jgi:hypothetical protein
MGTVDTGGDTLALSRSMSRCKGNSFKALNNSGPGCLSQIKQRLSCALTLPSDGGEITKIASARGTAVQARAGTGRD